MHELGSVLAFAFVLVAMLGLGWLLLRTFDGFLRLMGDHRRVPDDQT